MFFLSHRFWDKKITILQEDKFLRSSIKIHWLVVLCMCLQCKLYIQLLRHGYLMTKTLLLIFFCIYTYSPFKATKFNQRPCSKLRYYLCYAQIMKNLQSIPTFVVSKKPWLFLFERWEGNALLWSARWNYKSPWQPCNRWIMNVIQMLFYLEETINRRRGKMNIPVKGAD